jgi:hypothetical protein
LVVVARGRGHVPRGGRAVIWIIRMLCHLLRTESSRRPPAGRAFQIAKS